jgi:hypothetical protein
LRKTNKQNQPLQNHNNMKKTLLLIVALGLAASALPIKAVDVYITGSTAFRATVYFACEQLFTTTPTIYYADLNHGGNNKKSSSDTGWVMTGIATNGLSFAGSTLNIHALFNGSIQGTAAVYNNTPLAFPLSGTDPNNNDATTYITNGPTIAFCDVDTASTLKYDVANFSGFAQEKVAVQPFTFIRANAGSGYITNINNVTWEQLNYMITKGRAPASLWTSKASDTNSFIYLFNRTFDSGTLVSTEEELSYPYADSFPVYNYDHAATAFYLATNESFSTNGLTGKGVVGIGGPGFNNANLVWGSGYVGGGDIQTALGYNGDAADQAIAYLSFNDARSIPNVNSSGSVANWALTIAYNGTWPTAAGAGIAVSGGVTNDFSPVCLGNYPFWNYEEVIYPTGNPASGGISAANLGNQTTSGTFLGVLDHQTSVSGGSLLLGSIENEIEASKLSTYHGNGYGAIAIRLSDMTASRQTVGGTVAPIPGN